MFLLYMACNQDIQVPVQKSAVEIQTHSIEPTKKVYQSKSIQYEMRLIEAGSFTMGSKMELSARHEDETPHQVTLTKNYFIGVYEITQDNWFDVTGKRPSFFKNCDDCPVEQISWCDSVYFANQLSVLSQFEPVYNLPKGFHENTSVRECNEYAPKVKINWDANGFRLPTEAEWQYAAEGGGGFLYSGANTPDPVAWYGKNSRKKTHPIGEKKANAYHLYDMTGNVWEWCSDWHAPYKKEALTDPKGPKSGGSRIIRGGSWDFGVGGGRLNNRNQGMPGERSAYIGLRLARNAE